MTSITILKKELFSTFGGFADKRIKNLDRSSLYIIDDRSEGDVGADGKLYSYFCMMFATAKDGGAVQVELRGNVPNSSGVADWFEKNNTAGEANQFVFEIKTGEQHKLETLAKAFEDIVARGRRYPVSNYKYVCPRVAYSLRELRGALDRAWTVS